MRPGVNGPNAAGAPSDSDSVAATVPATGAVGAPAIAKSAGETSKKTFPTASTFRRAFSAVTAGSTTPCEPSFGLASASTYGNVAPPSVDSEIFTCVVLTGVTSVPATSHVTVCDDEP